MGLIENFFVSSVIIFFACSSVAADELKISADTNLPSTGKFTYAASNLIDEEIETAWCTHGGGNKPVFNIFAAQPLKLEGIGIFNGYQKNRQTYFSNSRPRQISIKFNGGIAKTYNLLDVLGAQWISIESIEVRSIRVEISQVYQGSRYNDVCVSELIFDRQVYEAYVLMKKMVMAKSEWGAMKPVFDIYDTNRMGFTNALALIGGQRNIDNLKFILNLAHYAESYRTTKDAELQEGLRDMIIPYIENSPDVVLAVLNTDKQVALARIDSAYVQYIDQFDDEALNQRRSNNAIFAKLMDVIDLRLSKQSNHSDSQ